MGRAPRPQVNRNSLGITRGASVVNARPQRGDLLKPIATLGLTLLVASPMGARAQAASLGAYASYSTLSGDDYQVTDAGFGFSAFFRYTIVSGFGLGAGVQLSRHNRVEGSAPSLHVLGVYAEPRYQFAVPKSIIKPLLGARVYWAHQSISAGDDKLKAAGFAVGGIGGLLFQLQPQLALEPALTFTHLAFGDWKLNGSAIPTSDTSGNSLGIQISFVVSFRAK